MRYSTAKSFPKLFSFFLIPLFLAGCVGHFAMASRLNGISRGMSKDEVIHILGNPERTASGPNYEDLTYTLNESAWDTKFPEPYIIRLVDGTVVRFGTKREIEAIPTDADSTLKPSSADIYSEITKLDELRKRGLLTDAEFESQKAKLLDRN